MGELISFFLNVFEGEEEGAGRREEDRESENWSSSAGSIPRWLQRLRLGHQKPETPVWGGKGLSAQASWVHYMELDCSGTWTGFLIQDAAIHCEWHCKWQCPWEEMISLGPLLFVGSWQLSSHFWDTELIIFVCTMVLSPVGLGLETIPQYTGTGCHEHHLSRSSTRLMQHVGARGRITKNRDSLFNIII